jgi:7-cyano-7-deazaguanine synthase
MMPRRLGMVLLSGGLDSTTAAAIAQRQGYELSALTLSYGQSHRREIEAARTIAEALGMRHHVVDIEFYRRLAWYSALTQPERFAIPTDRAPTRIASEIPITYVPLRNTLFLTLAAALLESEALHAIEREGCRPDELEATLFIAANAIDYSGYPDCRPEYYRAVLDTLRLGSKLGTQYGVPLRIATPLLTLSKAEIVRLAVELGAPLQYTWSCYQGGPAPCGRCDSCLLRAKGFQEAGLPDPAVPRLTTGQPNDQRIK